MYKKKKQKKIKRPLSLKEEQAISRSVCDGKWMRFFSFVFCMFGSFIYMEYEGRFLSVFLAFMSVLNIAAFIQESEK